MAWAILKPWNLALVAAVVVLSGPLTVAAICTSFLSATLLVFLASAILLHAAVTSICRVFFWPLAHSSPPSVSTSSLASRGGGHSRTLNSESPAPRQPSPLLVIQGSSRSRASRGNSFSQRVTLPVSNPGSSSSSTTSSGPSTASSASSSLTNGFCFKSNSTNGTAGVGVPGVGGHRQGGFGSGVGIGPTAGAGIGASGGRRHSHIPPVEDALDRHYGGTAGFYDDDDDDLDSYYYYPDDVGSGLSGGWPRDFATQFSVSSRLYDRGGDTNSKIRLLQLQQLYQQQQEQHHSQHLQLLTMLRSGSGQPLPVASNSSRRRASIGGVPSLLRAGRAGAGFEGSSNPTTAYGTSRSGSSTPWKRTRQASEFGL